MFREHVLTAEGFARRFVELLPEYLPGVDTGAYEPTDRRRCWNKSLKSILTVMGEEDQGLQVAAQSSSMTQLKDQSTLLWRREGAPLFAMATGWGDRAELQASLEWLEAFKCPQKLFVYTCTKWQEAVLDQIGAALLHYPYHIAGEQYLFMNMLGAEHRFHLFLANLDRDGRRLSGQDALLRTAPNSPFSWSAKRTASTK